MKKVVLTLLMIGNSAIAFAGDAENILACVRKANEFSGVTLSEFDASYQGNILSMSVAKWKNAFCEAKLGEVYTLQVNDKELIVNGYAGRESYTLKRALDEKTAAAINQLKSRIALLDQRMSQVSASLRKPNPDHGSVTRYIEEGIEKAVGGQR